MAKSKKYDYRVTTSETGWVAEIIRQVTSKKTVVSKSQDGFTTETEAKAWGQQELKIFVQNHAARSKSRSEQHDKNQRYRKQAT